MYQVCVADAPGENGSALTRELQGHGYRVVGVDTGDEALLACAKGAIDLLLVDVALQGMDGYEVCRRIKQSPDTADTAVILIAERGAGADVARGYQDGAVDFITKPYNLPMVLVRVEAALRKRETMTALREHQEALGDSSYTDCLTGLRNGRYLLERLQEEVEKAHRYDYPVSCVVFDIDQVRAMDEELGPASLDDLLVEIGMTIRDMSRTYDVLARYDGTQFSVVLPHTPLDQAVEYARKIMSEVTASTFSDPCFPTEASLSAGLVACKNGSAQGADFVLGEAMRSLLKAKSARAERLVARDLADR